MQATIIKKNITNKYHSNTNKFSLKTNPRVNNKLKFNENVFKKNYNNAENKSVIRTVYSRNQNHKVNLVKPILFSLAFLFIVSIILMLVSNQDTPIQHTASNIDVKSSVLGVFDAIRDGIDR